METRLNELHLQQAWIKQDRTDRKREREMNRENVKELERSGYLFPDDSLPCAAAQHWRKKGLNNMISGP